MTTTLPTQTTYEVTAKGAVVRRVIMDGQTTMWFEVSIIRTPRQVKATYQGTVQMIDGQFHALAATANLPVDLGAFADYVDAEAALLKRRSGVTSAMVWTGPRPRTPGAECHICGRKLIDGECRRLDLHWTPASLAAEDAERDRRRRARALAQLDQLTSV